MRFLPGSIKARLLVSFVLVALLPAIGIAIGSALVGYVTGRQQALGRLESVAALRELEINNWIQGAQNKLLVTLNDQYSTERISIIVERPKIRYLEYYREAVRAWLKRNTRESHVFSELFLLNLEGAVILSTDPTREQVSFASAPFFTGGKAGLAVQLFSASSDPSSGGLFVATPVKNQDGILVGVLAGRAKPDTFNGILTQRDNLGKTGKIYLLTQDKRVINQVPVIGALPQDLPLADALHKQADGSGAYRDFSNTQVLGVYRWLTDLHMLLVIEQDLGEAFEGILVTLLVNLSVALVGIFFGILAALLMTRNIANPLVQLSDTAARIAAGDLEQTAKVDRPDEIGNLARSFNSMNAQVRSLINDLENRVEERTRALTQSAIENARLYEQSQKLAVLEERNRLAHELHDSVTQSLFSIDLQAKTVATYIKKDPDLAETKIQALRKIARDALQEMRALIYNLRPVSLEDLGLVPALRKEAESLRRLEGPEISLEVTGERRLAAEAEQCLYRIAMEGLRNALKHANARRITISLVYLPHETRLEICDDGLGFDPQSITPNSRSFGLVGMKERASQYQGQFSIESQPGKGTRISVLIPT